MYLHFWRALCHSLQLELARELTRSAMSCHGHAQCSNLKQGGGVTWLAANGRLGEISDINSHLRTHACAFSLINCIHPRKKKKPREISCFVLVWAGPLNPSCVAVHLQAIGAVLRIAILRGHIPEPRALVGHPPMGARQKAYPWKPAF
jgi:hypothetical protein